MKPVILCVDDENIILKTLKSQLKDIFGNKLSYEMAESGEEALALIEELSVNSSKIEVIISDWMMPGMDGSAFLRNVHEQFPDIGLIILSGQADQTALENAKQAVGVQHCMNKPWTQRQLANAVNSILAKTASTRG